MFLSKHSQNLIMILHKQQKLVFLAFNIYLLQKMLQCEYTMGKNLPRTILVSEMEKAHG